MLLQFPTRVRVHFEQTRSVHSREGALDFEDRLILRQSLHFPRLEMLRALSSTSLSEISQLLPTQTRRPAYLVRQVFLANERHHEVGGMAAWSFRPLPVGSAEPSDCLDIDSVLFEETDWARKATTIVSNMPDVLAPERFAGGDSRCAMPRPQLDLPAAPVRGISDCAPLSFVMLDALAAGERPIFGRESFADDLAFFRACGDLLAMLPPCLRGHASFAAGFTRPIAGALIQWIDGHVLPPKAGRLTAELAERGADLTTDEISRRFDALPATDGTPDAVAGTRSEQKARGHFARVLADETPYPEAATCAWRTFTRAIADKQPAIALATMRRAESLVDALFVSASAPESLLARSRAGRHLLMMQRGCSLPTSDSAAIEDSIDAVEQALAAAKSLADQFGWTAGLEALSKAAITSLRKIAIEKSDTDIGINGGLLRAIARSPHFRRVVARLVGMGDVAVTEGIEQACAVAAKTSPQLRLARDKLAHEVFLVGPNLKSVPAPARREISLASVRLSLPRSPNMPFRLQANDKMPTPPIRALASTTSFPASRTY